MITVFLVGFLFGCAAFFLAPDKSSKWFFGIMFMIAGILIGLAVAFNAVSLIKGKYLAKNEVKVVEKHKLEPFLNSHGAYIVINENKLGKKAAWYLEDGKLKGLLENNYDELFNKGRIIFSNDDFPNRQAVRPIVGAFWKHFVFVSTTDRFVIPPGGLQDGSIKTRYEFVSSYSPKNEP